MSIRRERDGGKRFLRRAPGFALASGSVEPTHRAEGRAMNGGPGYINFLRLKAATSAADKANHSPLPRFSAKRLCQ